MGETCKAADFECKRKMAFLNTRTVKQMNVLICKGMHM